MNLSLTPVDPVADLDLIHGWVTQVPATARLCGA